MNNVLSLVFAAVCCFSGTVSAEVPEHRPMVIAHRGAPDFAPENTLAGFCTAVMQGADAVECDIHLTADGKLAVVHDDTTGRVWSADLVVADSTMRQLQELRPSPGFRAAFPRSVGERIPDFATVVKSVGDSDVRIFAELKSQGRAAADALYAQIAELGIAHRTTVISFSRDTVEYLAQKGISCAWLVICDNGEEVLSLSPPDGVALDINLSALSEKTVSELHGRGVTVYCFEAAGKADYFSAARMGVDGVTVDNISFLSR